MSDDRLEERKLFLNAASQVNALLMVDSQAVCVSYLSCDLFSLLRAYPERLLVDQLLIPAPLISFLSFVEPNLMPHEISQKRFCDGPSDAFLVHHLLES